MPVEQTQVTKNETVDTLTADGQPLGHNANLAAIFEKIEGGQPAADAVQEVMATPEPGEKEKPLFESQNGSPKEVVVSDEAEKKEEVRHEEKKEEAPKEEVKVEEEVVPEEELVVLPHDKPKTVQRIKGLLKKIDAANEVQATTAKELKEKADRLASLEEELKKTKSADPVVTDEIKQQLQDLKMFRRRYELDKDPEVATKFNSRLEQNETGIQKIIKDEGAGDALLKIITEEGGWAKFSDSKRVINLADGNKTTAAEYAELILENLPYAKRRAIDAAVIDQLQAKKDKDRFFEEEIKNAETYFDKKQLEAQQSREAQGKQIGEARELIQKWQSQLAANDWMKEREVPANATAAEKAAIEDDNKYTKQIRQLSEKYIAAKTVPEVLEALNDAVAYHQERRNSAKLQAQIKELQAKVKEYEEFKKQSTIPRKGSIAGGGSSLPDSAPPKKPRTLEETLAAMERGEDVASE